MYCSRGPSKVRHNTSVARYQAVAIQVAQLARRTVARDHIGRSNARLAKISEYRGEDHHDLTLLFCMYERTTTCS